MDSSQMESDTNHPVTGDALGAEIDSEYLQGLIPSRQSSGYI